MQFKDTGANIEGSRLNVLNELGISDKMRVLSGIYRFPPNRLNKFVNTGAWKLDFLIICNLDFFEIVFWHENGKILEYIRDTVLTQPKYV